MHDERTVLPSNLTSQDGALSASKVGRAHADTIGCENTNDRFSESVFGTFDRSLKRNEGCSREAGSALAHAARMKSFATGDAVRHRKALDAPSPPTRRAFCSKKIERVQLRVDRDVLVCVDTVQNQKKQIARVLLVFGYEFDSRLRESVPPRELLDPTEGGALPAALITRRARHGTRPRTRAVAPR